MKPVRFDLHCEGDIEKFSRWARDRVSKKKKTEVVLGVPNLRWPSMVVDMLVKEAEGEPDADDVYMDIDFDIKYIDDDLVATEEDIEEMFEDMTNEEIQDWINDMLAEFEDEKNKEGDDDDA